MACSASDTIVAVSSPPGAATRGLVRLSGDGAFEMLRRWLRKEPAANTKPRQMVPARLVGKDLELPVLVVRFEAASSYTGQDMVEIQLPGHPVLLDRMVHEAMDLGARLAEPGEFTFRAFLAGKIDLTQAEGIAATIAARSDAQLAAATSLRRGELGNFAGDLVDRLASPLALLEAGIDFVDQEDVVLITPGALDANLEAIQEQLEQLLRHCRSWAQLEALPRVVLSGPPSCGKSSLFNGLLGCQRAVIATAPGTTRDILSEALTLQDPSGRSVEVMLLDMAGLDTPIRAMDRQMQAAAREAIASADLVVHLDDGAEPQSSITLPASDTAPAVLRLRSKSDLGPSPPAGEFDLAVSAHTGQGIDRLRHLILERLGRRGESQTAQKLALQPRHEASLNATVAAVGTARHMLTRQLDGRQVERSELIASALRNALDELAALGGHLSPDEVIGRIFANFCIGK